MFECEHRWELVLWGSTEVLGVVSGISRQCLMHILADLLSKITSCEQLKGDCTKSPSPRGGHCRPVCTGPWYDRKFLEILVFFGLCGTVGQVVLTIAHARGPSKFTNSHL